jgi:hypothetical protein
MPGTLAYRLNTVGVLCIFLNAAQLKQQRMQSRCVNTHAC